MAPFPSPTKLWHTNTYQSISPTRPELSAEGKTIMITGGGSGIGAETALYFAKAGASRIGLLGRRTQPLLDTKALIEGLFPNIEVFAASTDVTKRDEVDTAFSTFIGEGKIDVLVSNAAMVGPQDSVEDVDSEKLLEAVHQNLKGSLLVAQAFLRHSSANAVVIDVNSAAAHMNFTSGFTAYSIAKLAVFRLWDSLAFAKPELSVYHMQPGVVDTAMNRESGGAAAVGFQDDVSLPASFIVWLSSSEAHFLKGKFLWANWDVDELKARSNEIEGSRHLNVDLVGWPFGDAGWQITWNSKTSSST